MTTSLTGLGPRLDFCGGAGIPVRGSFDAARGSGSPVLLESMLADGAPKGCSFAADSAEASLCISLSVQCNWHPGVTGPYIPPELCEVSRSLKVAPGFRRFPLGSAVRQS